MFQYIKIDIKDLDKLDIKTYHAYRCGLCKCLKDKYGAKGQMILKNDMTFLQIFLSGLYELPNRYVRFYCGFRPGKKRLAYINEASGYVSSMMLMTYYFSQVDDWKDDKSYPSKVLCHMMERDFREAQQRYPRQAKALEKYEKKKELFEKTNEKNIDLMAAATGELYAEIFVWKGESYASILYDIGYYLGKFMYLMDAYEDLDKDMKSNNYNPFVEMATDSRQDYETLSRLYLTAMIEECIKAFRNLPQVSHYRILENVLCRGV